MNGVHDMGGMHGFGPVPVEDGAAFHDDWEREVFGTNLLVMAQGVYNLDEKRHAVERIPPARYLEHGYFERWVESLELLLVEKGVLTEDEIETRLRALEEDVDVAAEADDDLLDVAEATFTRTRRSDHPLGDHRFDRGDRVRIRNDHSAGHTRVPRYIRRSRGTVYKVLGAFPVADDAARGEEVVEPLYSVRFTARELWGDGHPETDTLNIDLWERYLEAG